jgi:uncharacterized ferritin-like protein (DUF455 family)
MTGATLFQLARRVLDTAEPRAKAAAAREAVRLWRAGMLPAGAAPGAPARPARPARPELVQPGKVPRRRLNTRTGRAALLHAIAHIEFNAIDLAFDMLVRFGTDPLIPATQRDEFLSDWTGIGDDEARHFVMIADRLEELDSHYGELPAHNGLWDAAMATSGSLAARLAVAPLVLEARGLDVTPGMIDRLDSAGDRESAEILRVIYAEEIDHVAAGVRWFRTVCTRLGEDPETHFQALVSRYYRGNLKPPFNSGARERAGFPADFYLPLA